MFLRSIRFKIIFWHVTVSSLILIIFSIVLYKSLNTTLLDNVDDLLLSRAEGIIDSFDTFWEIDKFEITKDKSNQNADKIDRDRFINIAQKWLSHKIQDPTLLDIIIRIFDKNGEQIVSSKDIQINPIINKKIIEFVLKGDTSFDNLESETSSKNKFVLRTFTVPITVNGTVNYIVQISSPLTSVYSTLNKLKFALFFFLPLSIAFSSIVVVFLARLTLYPFNKMINTIRKISAENLKLRIPVPKIKDEIRGLAETFNEMLDRLENSFLSQNYFIEDLTHELKTPLSIIKGELEVTLKRPRSIDNYIEMLTSNLEETDRIIKLINDLLLFARCNSNLIPLEIKSVDVDLLLKNIIEDLKILAEQKNINIYFSSCTNSLIKGDQQKLKRLFLNLLDNAIKYTSNDGKIWINLNKDNKTLIISIKDTGIGIPSEEIPNIFKRFYRINKSLSKNDFGLGLSIAKSIIDAHKGNIYVSSKLNEGTVFTIHMPI